jgi:hypothetical protein
MGTLRYASAGPDRLWGAIEDRYFITEKVAAEKMNEALEKAATLCELEEAATESGENKSSTEIRAMKVVVK